MNNKLVTLTLVKYHFFFWFFESRDDPRTDPVVLWLNGGPGRSSLEGLFFENDPSLLDDDLKLRRNEYSWNRNANVLYLDQPVNADFFYTDGNNVTTAVATAKDVFAFLNLFF